jgi:hypothetical protein
VQLRRASGGMIAVPSIPLFQVIGTAIADFVSATDEAELTALAGSSWVAPGNTVVIA